MIDKNYLWIMRIFYPLLIIFIGLASCGENNKPEEIEVPTDINDPEANSYKDEASIRRHVEAQLQIPANEKYTLQIYSEHLDEDDSLDKLIIVNLYDRAIQEAIESGKVAKRAEVGYVGSYNYIFYVDGKTQVITSPIAVPSSPVAELKLAFENITSDSYKDIMIDYRIRNSCFRAFYTISHRIPIQISQTELFVNLGQNDQKCYFVELEESQLSVARNIVIYEGETEKPSFENPDDVYKFWPDIKKKDVLVRRWYYSSQYMKYYMRKDEI